MGFGETLVQVWKAGEIAPPGTAVRIDHRSYRQVQLDVARPFPASFDGKRARYRAALVWSGDDGQAELPLGGLHPRPEGIHWSNKDGASTSAD